jgi:hypothetical protein
MARKTKAELAAEREAYEAAQRAGEALTYPVLLMAALEEATCQNNYELVVRNGVFSLRDRDGSRYDKVVKLTYAYSPEAQDVLEEFEWDLKMKAEERAELVRKAQVRGNALAKLTEEERELLGLE